MASFEEALGRMKTLGGDSTREGNVILDEEDLFVDSVSCVSLAAGLEARVLGIVGVEAAIIEGRALIS